MGIVDQVLDALSDGEWHDVLGDPESRTEKVLMFFAKYGLVEIKRYRETAFGPLVVKQAKLSKSTFNFLNQLKGYENVKDEEEAKKSV